MPTSTQTSRSRVQAYATIKSWIEAGDLSDGESLPAERALAERLSLGRRPVRWAVEQLDREGLIRRASPRTRVVVGPQNSSDTAVGKAMPHGVLSGAVVVLSGERLPDEDRQAEYAQGWQMHVIYAAMAAVRAHGRHVLKLNTCLIPLAEIKELRDAGVAGVVVPMFQGQAEQRARMLDQLEQCGLRCVVSSDNEGDRRFDQVLPDHETGAYELTRLLIEKGRRRIVHLAGMRPIWWVEARLRGYRRAMAEAGLEPLPPLRVPKSDDWDATHGDAKVFARVARHNAGYLVDRLVGKPEPPDAFMCLSDESVSFVAAGARLCGVTPGKDVVLTGFDHYWHQSWGRQHEPTPPIATLDKNNPEIGRAMVDTLLAPQDASEPIRHLIPPRLIEVQSATDVS